MTFEPQPSDEEVPASGEPAASAGLADDPYAAVRSVHVGDWALLALGLATLIFSCFDFYHFSSNYAGSRGFSAWHDIAGGGFFGWFGVVLPVMSCVVLALHLFEPGMDFPVAARLLALYGWTAAFVSELLGIVVHPTFYDQTFSDGTTRHLGHGISFWFVLVLTLIGAVVALLRAQQTRTELPAPLRSIPTIGH